MRYYARTVQYNTVQYSTLQYSTVQYSTVVEMYRKPLRSHISTTVPYPGTRVYKQTLQTSYIAPLGVTVFCFKATLGF
jgi:hypothetical protein